MNAAADMTSAMVTMIAALAVVVGVILFLFYMVRRFSGLPGAPGRQRLVTVLGSTYLGVKKNISMVEVPGAVLVLGISADRISLLATIDNPSTIESIRRQHQSAGPATFLQQLQRAVGRKE